MSDDFKELFERSSFGTPEARALRETVSRERATELVRRSMEPLPGSEQ